MTGYKGVYKQSSGNFKAQYWDGDLKMHDNIGSYDTALEAAVAYAKHMATKGIYPDGNGKARSSDGSGTFKDDKDLKRPRKHEDQGPSHHDGPPPIDNRWIL